MHTDSADRSWQWRVPELLATDGAWEAMGPATIGEAFAREHMGDAGSKWAVVNAWRHVGTGGAPLRSTPLALLDDKTVRWGTDEVMYYPITLGDRVAFNYTLRHSEGHAWWYYPEMAG